MSDAFASEMVKLAPPELAKLSFRGSSNLTKFVLSPLVACPLLKEIDLSLSPKLEFVLIQSESVEKILLSRCGGVKKLLLHCKNLSSLNIEGCTSIETIMIWSDELLNLDLTGTLVGFGVLPVGVFEFWIRLVRAVFVANKTVSLMYVYVCMYVYVLVSSLRFQPVPPFIRARSTAPISRRRRYQS